MKKTYNDLIRQFDNHFTLKMVGEDHWELAGLQVMRVGAGGWRIFDTSSGKRRSFETGGYIHRHNAIRRVKKLYMHMWRTVEEIEEEHAN